MLQYRLDRSLGGGAGAEGERRDAPLGQRHPPRHLAGPAHQIHW